jgi:hypothetical protein
MASNVKRVNVDAMSVQGVSNYTVRAAVKSNAMEHKDYRIVRSFWFSTPIAIKETSMIRRSDKSVRVGDLSLKWDNVLR